MRSTLKRFEFYKLKSNSLNYFLVLLIYLLSFALSCKEELSNRRYISYLDDESNGLIVIQNNEGVKISCEFKTPEYILLKEKSKETSNLDSIKLLQKEVMEFENLSYFKLKLLSNSSNDFLKSNLQSESEYFSRLQYLQSNIIRDLFLVIKNDTFNCYFCEFERDYGLSGLVTLNLGFNIKNNSLFNSDFTFIFNDSKLGLGLNVFQFKKDNLIAIPYYKAI